MIRSLRETLRDLQTVLELLEKAEEQKKVDEEQLAQLEQALDELRGRRYHRPSR